MRTREGAACALLSMAVCLRRLPLHLKEQQQVDGAMGICRL